MKRVDKRSPGIRTARANVIRCLFRLGGGAGFQYVTGRLCWCHPKRFRQGENHTALCQMTAKAWRLYEQAKLREGVGKVGTVNPEELPPKRRWRLLESKKRFEEHYGKQGVEAEVSPQGAASGESHAAAGSA